MALTFTKKQKARMVALLDEGDFEGPEQAADAVLDLAQELLAERVKYTVVGQLTVSGNEPVPPDDERAQPFALGLFATQTTALSAGTSLWYSTQTHEQHRARIVPIHLKTPAAYYGERKADREADQMADKSFFQRELQRRVDWHRDHPGARPEDVPRDLRGVIPYVAPAHVCKTCGHIDAPDFE